MTEPGTTPDPAIALQRVKAALKDLDGWYENALRYSQHGPSEQVRAIATGRTLAYARAIETISDAINPEDQS